MRATQQAEERRPPRLLVITGDYPPRVGGQSRHTAALVAMLRDRFAVSVFFRQPVRCEEPGVVSLLDLPRFWRRVLDCKVPGRDLLLAYLIRRRLGSKFDVILAADSERSAFVAGYFSLFFSRAPVAKLCFGRDFSWNDYEGTWGKLSRVLLRVSALTIAISEKSRRLVADRGLARRTAVLYPSVSREQFRILSAHDPLLTALRARYRAKTVILTVSRLIERKGTEIVIKALSKVNRDFCFIVVGDGKSRPWLELFRRQMHLKRRIRFVGAVSDEELVRYYNLSDFFVMTPYEMVEGEKRNYEGFGLVYLEANACGKPVIGSRSGGVPEAIAHNRSGILVEPHDVDELAAAITRLIDDRDLYERLSRHALTWAEKFSCTAMRDNACALLESMIAESSPSEDPAVLHAPVLSPADV